MSVGDELPQGWAKSTLDAVAEWGSGGTPSRSNAGYYGGDIPWIKTGDLGEKIIRQASEYITEEAVKNSSAKFFQQGSVILAMYGATIGRTSILGIDATTNQACAVGQPNQATTTEFLYYLICNEKENFIAKGKGGAQPNISQGLIKEHEINLPPLAEQQQIVAKLDELLVQVGCLKARLDAIPKILKRFRQSVLAAAVSGNLTEEWRDINFPKISGSSLVESIQEFKKNWMLNNQNHNEVGRVKKRIEKLTIKYEEPQGLPNSWVWSGLEDICLMIVDCHNKTAPYVESGVPLIRTTNIRDGEFNWNDLRFVNEATYSFWSKRCFPESGDIIFTREAPMGEAAIIPPNKKLCLGQRTMLIRTVEELYSAKFMLLVFLDSDFKKRSEKIAVGTGVKHYRVGDVSDLIMPVPSTEEQSEIVRRVEQLFAYADQIEQRVKDAQSRVNHLTQSILAKAFRGELTAEWREQNPDLISGENSAEALLARIKAERNESLKNKSNRKKTGQ